MIRRQIYCVLVAMLAIGLLGYAPDVLAGVKKIKKCGTITAPGSYQLDKNLNATGDCLVIQANFVTIDLNGFTVTGDGTGDGITDGGVARKGIAIRNGTITGFVDGIDLFFSRGVSVEQVRAFDNSGDGIRVGFDSMVTGNTAFDNVGNGIFARFGSTVTGNTARSNNGNGIRADGDNTVTGNAARTNSNDGIHVGSGSTVTGNTANDNSGTGIKVSNGSTVTGNTARGNNGNGLEVDCPSNVIGNTATDNDGANKVLTDVGCNDINNIP